jgi:hypothetical protein
MAIEIQDQGVRTGYPVLKSQRIGEVARIALIKFEQRNVMKRNERTGQDEPVMKPNGKPRQELVVHGIALSGTTAIAGLGDESGVPAAGDRVRMILRGGGFGNWIEARKGHRGGKIQVGDIVERTTDWAQAYNADGSPKAGQIKTQAEADALPRSTTVGFYGGLTLAEPKDHSWTAQAEQAYMDDQAIDLGGDEEPAF